MPGLLLLIAWIVVGANSAYSAIKQLNSLKQNWMQVLLHVSVVIIALSFILDLI
ncbi:hypothetical protein [Alteribacter lacisalsi]|uniref:hypothetical protein n=1 Tax=Alteribacter lacisalsi TaxID=2045244 RepID=UPI001374B66B|nr:hypothetical protein [Alteribacter lacisalsi]